MKKYIAVCVLLLVTLSGLALPATAQDGGVLGLSAEDIGVLSTANDNSLDSDQWSFTYDVVLTVDTGTETIDVLVSGEGAVNGNDEVAFLTVTGNAAGLDLDGELRLIGETLYGRATDPTTGEDSGWIGFDLSDLDDANLDFEAFGEDFATEVMGDTDVNTDALLMSAMAFASVDPAAYLTATRTDEGNVATFALDVSLADMFRASGMTDVTVAVAEAFSDPLTNAEASAVNGILAEVFAETIINAEQRVNTEAQRIDGATFFLSSFVDPSDFNETGDPVNVVFTLDVNLAGYGEAVTVEQPDAITLPTSIVTDALGIPALDDDAVAEAPPEPRLPTPGDEIACNTNTYDFDVALGDTLTVTCPADCAATVWGTDPYTDDSSICTAAVHAGAIPASGGTATLEIVEGQESYAGSMQNGIETLEYGSWGRSFTFVTETATAEATCNNSTYDFDLAVGDTLTITCPADCNATIWGADPYTDDSSLCTAAVHAGVIPATGGTATLQVIDGQESYASTEQNGITSFDFGSWDRSFTFETGTASADGGEKTDTVAATTVDFPNTYTFPNGVSFGYPDTYEIQTESDVVTVIWTPDSPNFIQVYEMKSLFGDMDMGRDFFKDTYGGTAASTWDFAYQAGDFEDVEIGGKQYSVLDFEGTSAVGPTVGTIVIVPLDSGGFTYVQSYSTTTPPESFRDDTIAVATSISG